MNVFPPNKQTYKQTPNKIQSHFLSQVLPFSICNCSPIFNEEKTKLGCHSSDVESMLPSSLVLWGRLSKLGALIFLSTQCVCGSWLCMSWRRHRGGSTGFKIYLSPHSLSCPSLNLPDYLNHFSCFCAECLCEDDKNPKTSLLIQIWHCLPKHTQTRRVSGLTNSVTTLLSSRDNCVALGMESQVRVNRNSS